MGAIVTPVYGGRLLTAEEQRPGDQRVRRSRYEISADGLRMSRVRGKALSSIVYRRADGRFFLIEDKQSSYREVEREQILALLAKARKTLDTVEEEVSKMGVKEKEAISKFLVAGRALLKEAASGNEENLEFRFVGQNSGPLGLMCRKYEISAGGRKIAELWTAAPENIGFSNQELDVLSEVAELFDAAISSLTGIKETSSFLPIPRPGDYEGVPVRRVRFKEGEFVSDWRICASEAAEFAPDHFNPPPGYKKKAFKD